MTNVLYKQLIYRYPPLEGFDRITGYNGGLERISIILKSKEFRDAQKEKTRELITIPEIRDIAKTVFDDVAWEFDTEEGTLENTITFSQDKPENSVADIEYIKRYENHIIKVFPPFFYPSIELSIGWRGTSLLHPRQREKYLKFVNQMYNRFLENTKK